MKAGMELANQIHMQPLASCIGSSHPLTPFFVLLSPGDPLSE